MDVISKRWPQSPAPLPFTRKPEASVVHSSSRAGVIELLILGQSRMERSWKPSAGGGFAMNGMGNRDLQKLLYPGEHQQIQRRRQSAAITRKLALLRAHGLIRKVSGSHRYLLSPNGRRIITALLAARRADVDQLTRMAA